MRCNENEQLLHLIGTAFALKQISQPGNILQKRCAGVSTAGRFFAQTADDDGLAVILNRDFKGKGLMRAIVLLPWIIPTALSAICFWWLYDSTFSGISWFLMKLGIIDHFIDFLGDPWNARWSLIAANVWRFMPYITIMLLAGLQGVPGELKVLQPGDVY